MVTIMMMMKQKDKKVKVTLLDTGQRNTQEFIKIPTVITKKDIKELYKLRNRRMRVSDSKQAE